MAFEVASPTHCEPDRRFRLRRHDGDPAGAPDLLADALSAANQSGHMIPRHDSERQKHKPASGSGAAQARRVGRWLWTAQASALTAEKARRDDPYCPAGTSNLSHFPGCRRIANAHPHCMTDEQAVAHS